MTPWTVAWQVPLSIGFSRQEYWSGLPFPSPLFPLNNIKYHPNNLHLYTAIELKNNFQKNNNNNFQASFYSFSQQPHFIGPCMLPLFKISCLGLPWWLSGKESACQCRGHRFKLWSRETPHAVEQLNPCAAATEPVL